MRDALLGVVEKHRAQGALLQFLQRRIHNLWPDRSAIEAPQSGFAQTEFTDASYFRPLLAAGLLASGVTSAATTITAAAVKTAEHLRDQAMQDDTGYAIVKSLTTEVGARMAGSDADQRAHDWAVAKFKSLGFDEMYTEPASYPLWVRRSEHAAIVAPFHNR